MSSHTSTSPRSKLSSLKRTKRAPRPYDSAQRLNPRRDRGHPRPSTSKPDPPSSFLTPTGPSRSLSHAHGTSTTASSSSTIPTEGTRRESYLDWIRDKYPTFEPQDDYEILTLVGSNYRGPESGIRSWLDSRLKIDVAFSEGLRFAEDVKDPEVIVRRRQRFIERASTLLNMKGSITGVKPKPRTRNVFRHPIPNSSYSIRLFPGSIAQREHCLDFVRTTTGEPVNSPLGFEVWKIAETPTPWLGGGTTRVRSLEHSLGFSAANTASGAEKFVLRDGQMCLLKRLGYKDLQFKVPTCAEGLNLPRLDVEQLHFPELV